MVRDSEAWRDAVHGVKKSQTQLGDPTSNAEEAKVEQFDEDLQDLLEVTTKKDVLFIIGD